MSDVSQGPGWWQASDGKWYAPELHPDYVAPPPTVAEPGAPPPTSSPAPSAVPEGGGADGRSATRSGAETASLQEVVVLDDCRGSHLDCDPRCCQPKAEDLSIVCRFIHEYVRAPIHHCYDATSDDDSSANHHYDIDIASADHDIPPTTTTAPPPPVTAAAPAAAASCSPTLPAETATSQVSIAQMPITACQEWLATVRRSPARTTTAGAGNPASLVSANREST